MPRDDPGAAEADLVARLRTGRDPDAFRAMVRLHGPAVRAYARGMLGDPDDADDAAQEVFLRAHRRLTAFRGDAGLLTWLLRICRNHCLDRLRARRPPPLALSEDLSGDAGTEDAALARVERDRLLSAVARLPEAQQQVLVLCELRGWSYAETAAALGIPEGTVRSRLHAGRAALRAALEGRGR